MKLVRYWTKSTYRPSTGGEFIAWGWSDENLEDAQILADQRAKDICDRFNRGEELERYRCYHDRPLREELIEIIVGPAEEPTVVITRNIYGCRILNTSEMMFIDVDLPEPSFWESLRYRFHKFIGRKEESPKQQIERQAIAQAEKLVQADRNCGIRVYRTRSGLRYLLTHTTFNPASEGTAQLMEFVDADPLYQKLCQTHDCFRARLTPKPWRCKQKRPPSRFPWPDKETEAEFRVWEDKYEAESKQWATCHLVKVLGSTVIDPTIAPIVEFHDKETQANSNLKLA